LHHIAPYLQDLSKAGNLDFVEVLKKVLYSENVNNNAL
jgi:hypothetical protein